MVLTEEQKQRIEENRQKALAKRAQKDKPSSSQEESGSRRMPCHRPRSVVSSTSCPRFTTEANRVIPDGRKMIKLEQKTRCKFVMVSRQEFKADMAYHPEAIAAFKSVSSGRYNAVDRVWSFDMAHHEELAKRLRDIGSAIILDALPVWVTNTFLNLDPTRGTLSASNDSFVELNLWDNLMPFQQDGVRFALERDGNVLLADDMGLGKTIQSLAIASAFRQKWPLLIVCPSSMRFAWKSAIVRWLPSVPEEDTNVITSGTGQVKGFNIIVISYDLVSRKEKELKECRFRIVILDESHFLKNYKSQRCRAVTSILKESSEHSILLSGTPALSRPIELYPQICLVDETLFRNVADFGMRYCDGRKVSYGQGEHYDFKGNSNMQELKLLMEERFMLRRLKSQVLSQLPAKQRQMVILDPSLVKSQTKQMLSQAKQMSSRSLSKMERKSLLLEWFHTTADAKCKAVQEYLKDLLEGGVKFVCFAHHRIMLDNIEKLLQDRKCGYVRIDGCTKSETRAQHCSDFQTKEKTKVALLSITAASTGITLTSAQVVVFAELFWNPGILTQAEDRAHRIGQTDSVTVRYLVATNTADDELWPMIQKKLDVLNKAGLSKENFMESDAENLRQNATKSCSEKITSHLTPRPKKQTACTQEEEEDVFDLAEIDWDDDFGSESKKRRKTEMVK